MRMQLKVEDCIRTVRQDNMELVRLNWILCSCILTVAWPNLTWIEDCDEQLLFTRLNRIEKLCWKTKESEHLRFEEDHENSVVRFELVAYGPANGGTIVAWGDGKLVSFLISHPANATRLQRKQITDLSWSCEYFPTESPKDMVVDWTTNVVYVLHEQCRNIKVYDLERSGYATVYTGRKGKRNYEASPYIPRAGMSSSLWHCLLFWTQDRSLLRASLDGKGVETLMVDANRLIVGVAVDHATSLLYWMRSRDHDIFQCDLDGNNQRKLSVSPQMYPIRIKVFAEMMYWQGFKMWGPYPAFRVSVHGGAEESVLNGLEIWDMQVLPTAAAFVGLSNPCRNRPCSHICVRSNTEKKFACICPDDLALDKDGHNCGLVRRRLLVSTGDGTIWQLPILNGSAVDRQPLLVQNISYVESIQCDKRRRRILWAQTDERSMRILELDMEDFHKPAITVFKYRGTVRSRHKYSENLEAFAVDWITGNLYMAFYAQRRFLVCGKNSKTTRYCQCAELFGNKVGFRVGGLVLDPDQGNMYWTERGDQSPAVVKGGMNGRWLQILKQGALMHPTSIAIYKSFRVYWINEIRHRIEYTDLNGKRHDSVEHEDFFPQRIAIEDENMYWASSRTQDDGPEAIFKCELNKHGKSKPGADSAEFDISVPGSYEEVSGLWMCDADFKWRQKANICEEGHPCAGICLLSGNSSFRCVCPVGFKSFGSNGHLCKEIEEPDVIYSQFDVKSGRGTIIRKKGLSEHLIWEEATFEISMAVDPVRNFRFWLGCGPRPEMNRADGGEPSVGTETPSDCNTVGTYRLSPSEDRTEIEKVTSHPQFLPLQGLNEKIALSVYSLEYDWVGENIYVQALGHGVRLCGLERDECTAVLEGVREGIIALDPANGRLYWGYKPKAEGSGIWKGSMDGSEGTLIVPDVRIQYITVDHSSQLIFWVQLSQHTSGEIFDDIFSSGLDGGDARFIIRMPVNRAIRIRVAGDRLAWMSWRRKGEVMRLQFCDKLTGDNLVTQNLAVGVTDLLLASPTLEVELGQDRCIPGSLCSHMCIPTPTEYMRCLCPAGYKLMSDRRTCACSHSTFCNISNIETPPTESPAVAGYDSGIKKKRHQEDCAGNEFPCLDRCLNIDTLCNGVPDCPDLSDEGEGKCNGICRAGQGCLHNCTRSPAGPICFCPPDQVLAADNKSCIALEIRTEESLKVGLAAGAVTLSLTIVIIVGTVKYRLTRRKLRDLTKEEIDEFMDGDPMGALVAPTGHDRAWALPYEHVIPADDIIMAWQVVLGRGAFGVVHPGICHLEPVAIKVLKRSMDADEFKAVLAEVKIMAYLGDHEFIVKFVGADISEIASRKIRIVTELSPNGDLLRHLWNVASVGLDHRSIETGAGKPPHATTRTLMYTWCEQIATGMENLTQKKIVHGDLAARNVLLFKGYVAKVSDFGLSKNLYGCATYQTKKKRKLPWRAASIELLISSEFSEGSDVWAFGVTVWEIFSLGRTPYTGMRYGDEFTQFLLKGNRLAQPEFACESSYSVMRQCWDSEKGHRPSFSQLKHIFHGFAVEKVQSLECAVNAAGLEYISAV